MLFTKRTQETRRREDEDDGETQGRDVRSCKAKRDEDADGRWRSCLCLALTGPFRSLAHLGRADKQDGWCRSGLGSSNGPGAKVRIADSSSLELDAARPATRTGSRQNCTHFKVAELGRGHRRRARFGRWCVLMSARIITRIFGGGR